LTCFNIVGNSYSLIAIAEMYNISIEDLKKSLNSNLDFPLARCQRLARLRQKQIIMAGYVEIGLCSSADCQEAMSLVLEEC